MAPQPNYVRSIYRLHVGLVSLLFLALVFPYISSVLLIVVFALLLTTILLPVVDQLERHIKSRALSVGVVIALVISLNGIFLSNFTASLVQQARIFSVRLQQEDYVADLSLIVEKVYASLPAFAKQLTPDTATLVNTLKGQLRQILQHLLSVASVVGNAVFYGAMIFIFTIILLFEYHAFKRSLVQFIPNKYFEIALRVIYNMEKQLYRYLWSQLLAAGSVALMSMVGLMVLNMLGANLPLTIFIGIIAGLSNLIPLVGPIIGMVLAVAIAIMNNLGDNVALTHQLFGVVPSPFYMLDIILLFILVQQIESNLLTPMLVGKSVGLHPMLVMMALLIGGTLLGPLGLLFAVPAAGIIKVIGNEIAFVSRYAHLL